MQRNDQEGMTLVEILAAITILGILFVGIMAVFPQMTNFNEKTEEKLETMNLARLELNLLKEQKDNQFLLCRYGEGITSGSYDNPEDPKRTDFTRSQNHNGQTYQYDVTHYERSEANLLVRDEKGDVIRDGDHTNLYQVHIKIKEDERTISETFGYVPYDIVATNHIGVDLECDEES